MVTIEAKLAKLKTAHQHANPDNLPFLIYLARAHEYDTILWILNEQLDKYDTSGLLGTLLQIASEEDETHLIRAEKLIEHLLTMVSPLNERDEHGQYPAMQALQFSAHPLVLRILNKSPPEIATQPTNNGESLILIDAMYSSSNFYYTPYVLKICDNFACTDPFGDSPLAYFLKAQLPHLWRPHLNKWQPEIQNKAKETLLHHLAQNEVIEQDIRPWLSHLDDTDINGQTPPMKAIAHDKFDTFTKLVRNLPRDRKLGLLNFVCTTRFWRRENKYKYIEHLVYDLKGPLGAEPLKLLMECIYSEYKILAAQLGNDSQLSVLGRDDTLSINLLAKWSPWRDITVDAIGAQSAIPIVKHSSPVQPTPGTINFIDSAANKTHTLTKYDLIATIKSSEEKIFCQLFGYLIPLNQIQEITQQIFTIYLIEPKQLSFAPRVATLFRVKKNDDTE